MLSWKLFVNGEKWGDYSLAFEYVGVIKFIFNEYMDWFRISIKQVKKWGEFDVLNWCKLGYLAIVYLFIYEVLRILAK